jgi:hypothetical protein
MIRSRSVPWLLLTVLITLATGACATTNRTVTIDADDTTPASSPATATPESDFPVQAP